MTTHHQPSPDHSVPATPALGQSPRSHVTDTLGRGRSVPRRTFLFAMGVGLSFAIAACGGGTTTGTAGSPEAGGATSVTTTQPRTVEITLVSFAVTKAAHDRIIPKFVEEWKRQHNQTVVVKTSYGGSGSQTRAIIDGLDADVVHLAVGSDVAKLEEVGLIQPGWEQELPNNGIASQSVAAIVTREGNPKGIQDWADLTKEGVTFITADPKSSGGAKWNFLALWNAVTANGGSEAEAQEFVAKAYANVPILAKDARESTDVFLKGQGDALINYENELILAQLNGEKVSYVIPQTNIAITNPVAVVDANVDKKGTREVATALAEFLFTPEAQNEFAAVGFRAADPSVIKDKAVADKFPTLKAVAKIEDFGGWPTVQKKFFDDGAIFDQVQANIKR